MFSVSFPMARLSTGFRYQELFKVPHAAHLLLPYPEHSTLAHAPTWSTHRKIHTLAAREGRGRDHSVWPHYHSAVTHRDHNVPAPTEWDQRRAMWTYNLRPTGTPPHAGILSPMHTDRHDVQISMMRLAGSHALG